MEKLKQDLINLNRVKSELENQIQQAKIEAENNIQPLKIELDNVKKDKTQYAAKGDLDSVQTCRRKEENLKFKINAQWNKYSLLKNDLVNLNKEKIALEKQIKLEEDKIKRKTLVLAQMDEVLKNYKKTQNLYQAAVDSKINPNHVDQWYEWGKNDFNEIYSYFFNGIIEIDNYFKDLESQKLKKLMDSVIEAYKNTNSLKEASKISNVSYDTVQYWYEWGSKGFGSENTYFFKNISNITNI